MSYELVLESPRVGSDRRRVLVVEDDLAIQPAVERMIRKINPAVEIDWFTCAEDALAALSEPKRGVGAAPYHVVLADIQLEGWKSGMDLVSDCYRRKISANFVLTSSNRSFESRLPFIPKPYRFEDVKTHLEPYLGSGPAGGLSEGGRDEQLNWSMIVMAAAIAVWIWSQSVHQ